MNDARAVIGRLGNELLALVVPPLCAVCGEPEIVGRPLCPGCRRRLLLVADPRCRHCGAPGAARRGCPECRGRTLAFDSAWAPYAYEGVARRAVGALKSRARLALAESIAVEIAGRAPDALLAGTIVPVPAHRRRRRRQGFNHAGEIARRLARHTSLPLRDLLVRDAAARPQLGLERHARLRTAPNSVRVRSPAAVPGRIVLVDDVYTTGATLDACAHALKAAGAERVVAVTFARALIGKRPPRA